MSNATPIPHALPGESAASPAAQEKLAAESTLFSVLRLPVAQRDEVLARFGLVHTSIGVVGHMKPRGSR